jgi:hypothetical protein
MKCSPAQIRDIHFGRRIKTVFDIRNNERYEFSDNKVEYTLGHFLNDEIFEADLINVSERGLCMVCPHNLAVGHEITLKHFMGYPSRTAVVIWIIQHEETVGFGKSDQALFKIGLQFSD